MTMRKEPAVLIQISDPHLLADKRADLRGVVTCESLTAILDQTEKQFPLADAYVFTGDLSHDGSPMSYRNLKDLLVELPKPVYTIPGNHDHPENMRRYLLGGNVQFPDHVDLGIWRLIFLDTRVAEKEYGYLCPRELEKLRNSLRTGPPNKVVCIHHPAIPLGSAWIDNLMLRNADEMFDIVKGAVGATVFLSGHAHQEYVVQRSAATLMGAPSTCTQFKPGTVEFEKDEILPGFRVVELDDSGSFETRVVRPGSG